MKRKTGVLLIIAIFTTIFLYACSSNDKSNDSEASNNDDKTVIKIAHRWPGEPQSSYFDELVEEFEKENPDIQVDQTTALNDDYKQKIKVMLGEDNAPDVFFTWVGKSFGDEFIDKDIAMDLTEYYEDDEDWSDKLIATEPFVEDDKYYGVPIYTDSKVFYYNKEMFDEYNLEEPETWEEFIDILDTLKENGETPIQFGNQASWAGGHYITALNQRMVDKETVEKDYEDPDFSDPMYVEALKKFQELLPYTNESVNAEDHEETRTLFTTGSAAITFMETFEATYMEDDADYEWDTFNFPEIKEGEGDQSGIIGAPEGFMVHNETDHPEEAMKLLKFITSEAMGEKLTKETGMPSSVEGTVNNETATEKEVELTDMIAENEDDILNWIDQGVSPQLAKVYTDEF